MYSFIQVFDTFKLCSFCKMATCSLPWKLESFGKISQEFQSEIVTSKHELSITNLQLNVGVVTQLQSNSVKSLSVKETVCKSWLSTWQIDLGKEMIDLIPLSLLSCHYCAGFCTLACSSASRKRLRPYLLIQFSGVCATRLEWMNGA